jgi:hypothetical protein
MILVGRDRPAYRQAGDHAIFKGAFGERTLPIQEHGIDPE